MLVGVHSFSKSVSSTYYVQRGQARAMNRARAALPALLQFPLEGGSGWGWRAKSGVGAQSWGGPRVGVGADRRESGSPRKGEVVTVDRGLPPAVTASPPADQALASRWVGRAQKPGPPGGARGGSRGREGQALTLLPACLPPVLSPLSWAPGWTSIRRTSVSPPTSPASGSWWPTCSSTCLAPGPAGARGPRRGRAGG